MTEAERAVLDAARAYAQAEREDLALGGREAQALLAAVRALPRPLSEQLAELRAGDVVEVDADLSVRGKQLPVIANNPRGENLWLDDGSLGGALFAYAEVSRVISNPEASDGR